jgi:hypothetical protein
MLLLTPVLQQRLRHVLTQGQRELAAAQPCLQALALHAHAGLEHAALQHHL